MRILMVSAYVPSRDGIALYARQEVERLRADGHDVEVLSPGPSAAHHHLDLRSRRAPLALARRLRAGGYDRVVVQFHPDYFYVHPATRSQHVMTSLGLAIALRAADVEVRIHEADYSIPWWSLRALAQTLAWRGADRLVLHTEPELRSFRRTYRVPARKLSIVAPGAHYRPHTGLDRAAARRRLGLPPDDTVFLSIGFIQEHKGFDRAVRAFEGLHSAGCRLDIVGSVRVDDPGQQAYVDNLRDLVSQTDGVHMHEGYVSDELFDVWLVAADVVVVPYRHIWSSAVAERAALFDRPVIATRVGGLESQLRPGDVLVDDDRALAEAMWSAARRQPVSDKGDVASSDVRAETADQPWPAGGDRRAVMEIVQRRAAVERGYALRDLPAMAARSAGMPSEQRARRREGRGRSVPPLRIPAPAGTGIRGAVKRFVRRLTAWEIDPIVAHINRLQAEIVERPERRPTEEP